MSAETRCSSQACKPVQFVQHTPAGWEKIEGAAILESPLTLTVNGEVWLTFMCTPTDLEALALGFLYNENIISSMHEVASLRVCPHADNVDVWLTQSVEKPGQWRRTTGCTGGLTGVDAAAASQPPPVIYNGVTYRPDQLGSLIGLLYDSQDLYRQAGGVHTSALCDGHELCVVAEDIGRHNTLDKLAGLYLLKGLSLSQRLVLTTGRVSSEMLQKAARLGAALVLSRTAASALAIELAQAWNITLIGYARRDRFRIYTHPERIYG